MNDLNSASGATGGKLVTKAVVWNITFSTIFEAGVVFTVTRSYVSSSVEEIKVLNWLVFVVFGKLCYSINNNF